MVKKKGQFFFRWNMMEDKELEAPIREPEVVLTIESGTPAPTTITEKEWDPNHYKEKEKCTIFCPCKCCYVSTRICCCSCKDCCKGFIVFVI